MKKMEKPQVVNNREYLDMDTDEEEFGRQETPELEEETEVEPDKPVFTEEELKSLVQFVKDFTILSSPEESNWSPEVVETVEEYFRNPAKIVLTIFHESGRLKSFLDFPERTDNGLTYFLRSPWQIYTKDNFLSTVIFGSVNETIENSTLKFVDNMYAPIAFHSNEWPAVTRNEVFTNLHEFLMCLTDATYNPIGLTIFYVPREGLEDEKKKSSFINDETTSVNNFKKKIDPTEDNEAESLIERLERVTRYWIRQIRETLNGSSTFSRSLPCKTIADEILYWTYRCLFEFCKTEKRHDSYENLSCVYNQLTNKNIVWIIEKLECEGSASVKQYNPLLMQVHRFLNEATSNITYLNLLEEFNRGFEIPNGVEEYAKRIFLSIRFIGTESSFYRSEEKIEKLCRAFGTQVVECLQRYMDLDIIFEGDPRDGKKMIYNCTDCCKNIRNIYTRLVSMDTSLEKPIISLTDEKKIFNHVDTFVQRCEDLITIIDSRITFDKSDECIRISGPRGMEFEKLYENIERHFNAILCEIKNRQNDILDIGSSNWHKRIIKFKDGLKNIENMVKNWINDIFKNILNIEEGIEALSGVKRFVTRINLSETLNDKWIQIWKLFSKELEYRTILTNKNSQLSHHWSLPKYSGNVHLIRSNKIYLIGQYKMLIDASDWFGDCPAQNVITKNYKNVLASMSEKEESLFLDWQKYLKDKKIYPETLSHKSILKYLDNKKKGICVNLEIYYLENIREIAEWNILNYETKNIFPKNCPTWQLLKCRYNKVENICKSYNEILTTVSKSEIILVETWLEELEDIINLGFEKVTWTSESFERFVVDCMEIITKIYEALDN